ncbi:MAG: hypothetical protein AB2404_11990 [Planifilum fimeticola]
MNSPAPREGGEEGAGDRFGVPSSMLTAKGCGEKEPLVPNDTEANRQKNRRVEFVVQPK